MTWIFVTCVVASLSLCWVSEPVSQDACEAARVQQILELALSEDDVVQFSVTPCRSE